MARLFRRRSLQLRSIHERFAWNDLVELVALVAGPRIEWMDVVSSKSGGNSNSNIINTTYSNHRHGGADNNNMMMKDR